MNREELKYVFGQEKLKSILVQWYETKKLSSSDIEKEFKSIYDIDTTSNVVYLLLKEFGITIRDQSEAVSLAKRVLDYEESIIDKNPSLVEVIDGLLISDASISNSKSKEQKYHRISISSSQEEFMVFCRNLLKPLNPTELNSRDALGNSRNKGYEKKCFGFNTAFHPDITKQRIRWYYVNKIIPRDIKITPLMLKLWYYGDGSIVTTRGESNSCVVRLSTDGFVKEDVDFIIEQLEKQANILSKNNDNRIIIKSDSIPLFFNYIGRKSDLSCYAYKFDVDEWRFWTSMKSAATNLGISYNRLSHLVKTESIEFNRSPGGKKVFFTESQLGKLKQLHSSGLLEADPRSNSAAVTKGVFVREPETESKYKKVFSNGFPYVNLSDAQKIIMFNRLNNVPVIAVKNNEIQASYRDNDLAINYHPHLFSVICDGYRSPEDAFYEKKTLMGVVENMTSNNIDLSDENLRYNICRSPKTKRTSVFPVRVAKTVYTVFGKEGMEILDPCAGYSSRLLGFYSCPRGGTYYGIDPCVKTFNGLTRTKEEIEKMTNNHKSVLFNDRAEKIMPCLSQKFDIIFTSPPYFDLERYSDESTQSYRMYPEYEDWLDKFLFVIIKESYRLLKDDGVFILNIANSRSHKIIEHVDMYVKNLFRVDNVILMLSPSKINDVLAEPIYLLKKKLK